jgi:hypothetical protein
MKKSSKLFLSLAIAQFLFFSHQILAQQEQPLSIPGIKSELGESNKAESLTLKTIQSRVERGELPLSRLHEYIKPASEKEIRLPKLSEIEKLQPTADGTKVLRIGLVRQIPRVAEFSKGTSFRILDGTVWTVKISVEEAVQMRLRFDGMNLPEGAKLFVYSVKNPDEVYTFERTGATENGDFWTPPIEGSSVVVEYFAPIADTLQETALPFQIAQVSDIFRDPLQRSATTKGTPQFPSCHNNVPSAWTEIARGVGHLQFVTSGGGEAVCTGTLLASTINDFDPILLTANHCFSSQSSAQSLRVYWHYNGGDFPSSSLPRTDGATLLSTGPTSDYTLVRLLGTIPIRTNQFFWSGWNANQPTSGTPISGIHHPSGSYKRYSSGAVIDNYCPYGCAGHLGVRWQSGTTEGGSSGSGLWTGSGGTDSRLVGTLHGGETGCSNIRDTYGSFATTFTSISSFLQGGSDDSFDSGNGNDTRAAAVSVPAANHTSLVVKYQDSDWYKVVLTNGGRLTVAASFTHSNGDIDMKLYRGAETNTVATSESAGNSESIDFTNTSGATQEFYLNVYLYDGVRNTYNMNVGLTGAAPRNKKTVGVFRPSNGITYLRNSNTGGFADINMVYGVNGDTSFAGDWNGDKIDSIGIYRNGVFYLRNSNTTGPADIVFAFGAQGDQPVAGDWNGDGIDTIGVYRPTTGVFMLRNSNTAGAPDVTFVLGNPGDVAIAGDWNGDGITTTGVFRPTNGIIYLKNTNVSGNADIGLVYGNAGDKPVAGDWDGDGQDSIGIYRNGVFYLRNSNTQGFADLVFALGDPGDEPIAGDWDGLP